MKFRHYVGAASVACGMALIGAAPALASDVDVAGTGAGSNQSVVVDNSSTVNETNSTSVTVTNTNVQTATTDSVVANDNTSVGNLSSGDAINSSRSDTAVTIGDVAGAQGDQGVAAPSSSETAPQGGGGVQDGSGSGGSVLGAATVNGGLGAGSTAVLPAVGALSPIDVSALRAAWHPQSVTPAAAIAKNTSGVTAVMLIVAALLSAAGGIGSAVYGRRKEGRV